jgi:hypothetical protein
MVGSGLIGRFIYTKIHHGLYGQRVKLKQLNGDREKSEQDLLITSKNSSAGLSLILKKELAKFEQRVSMHRGMLGNFFNIVLLGINTRWSELRLRRLLAREFGSARTTRKKRRGKIAKVQTHELAILRTQISVHLATIRKIAGLAFYERLFSLWHLLHLPIFFMLIATGLVHVYAVHAY